jgi:hypothetical protein
MTRSSIENTDYILVYAPTGQSAEMMFSFDNAPQIDLSNALGVAATTTNSTLTLNYVTGSPAWIRVSIGQEATIVIVIMDKVAAGSWHAPVIAASGTFGNYFSIGTNETSVINCALI